LVLVVLLLVAALRSCGSAETASQLSGARATGKCPAGAQERREGAQNDQRRTWRAFTVL
jgi:hypothetical protein